MVKNPPAHAGDAGDAGDVGAVPGLGRSPGERKWQPTSLFLPKTFHRQRNLAGLQSMGLQRVGHD